MHPYVAAHTKEGKNIHCMAPKQLNNHSCMERLLVDSGLHATWTKSYTDETKSNLHFSIECVERGST